MLTLSAATMGETGEFAFLSELLPKLAGGRGVLVGPGDDCAVVAVGTRRLLLTTDALVERVHFERRWMTPHQLGRRAYLVNASDIAAMGGRPRFCLLSAGVPASLPARELMQIERGVAAAAQETGAALVGGNLTRAARLFLSVTLIGDAPRRPARRDGARPGDFLFVTGALGEAALGLRRLRRDARATDPAARRFREPLPRLTAGALLVERRIASAMIDVSDGLLGDLAHVCAASGVGAEVSSSAVPRPPGVDAFDPALAFEGGDDYELLFTVRPRQLALLDRLRSKLGCAVTRIGRITPRATGVRVVDRDGRAHPVSARGHDHFGGPRRSPSRSRR
jgi:thiamine-monophosphate kinase